MDQEDYIKKWLNDTLTKEEQKAFEQTVDFSFLQNLDNSLKRFKAPDLDISEEIDRLDSSLEKPVTRVITWQKQWLKIAASLIIAISAITLILYSNGSSEPVQVSSLEKLVMYLPDSSFVALNAHSSLLYDKDSWEESRKVELQGEAFFQVRKGSTFEIITSSGKVQVVGTQFNVKNRTDYFEVNCFEGQVMVTSMGKKVSLSRQESFRVLDGKVQSINVELSEVPDWRKGESKFKSVPFIQVIKELERQYNIEVESTNINTQQLFTGAFTHDNINLALKSISIPLNLSYQLEGSQVQILGAQ